MRNKGFLGTIINTHSAVIFISIFLLAAGLSTGCGAGDDAVPLPPVSSDETGDQESGGYEEASFSDFQEIVNESSPDDIIISGDDSDPADDEDFTPSNTRMISFLPEEADGIISINMEGAGQTEVIAEMLEEAKSGQSAGGYIDFLEKSGIDPQNDIEAAAIAETAGIEGESSGLILARLKSPGIGFMESLINSGFSEQNYNGITLLSDTADNGQGYSAALINQDTLAVGAVDMVKKAIDLSLGFGESILSNQKLNYLIEEFDPGSLISFAYEYPEEAKITQSLGGLLSLDLTGAKAIAGNLNFKDNIISGGISLLSPNAIELVAAFNSFKQMIVQSGGSLGDGLKNITLASSNDRVNLNIGSLLEASGLIGADLSRAGIMGRVLLKRFLYSMMSMNSAMQILRGKEQPIIDFVVNDTPPSIFYNFIVPDDKAQALAQAIPLPDNFTLAKMRCLESDSTPHYYISLNIYRVSGITNGLRAEWSTYVYDENDTAGRPRFMIIEARTDSYSMDPIDIITLPSVFNHDFENNQITSLIKDTKYLLGIPYRVDYFESSIDLSGGNYTAVAGTRDWTAANDYIYWKNGVCDRAYYNGRLHNAQILSIEPGSYTFKESSKWKNYIQSDPESVLVFGNELEFAISPWFNIFDENLQMGSTAKRNRQFIKCVLYGMMSLSKAAQIIAGTADPLIRFNVADTPPSIFINYRVPDENAAALSAAIPLPEGYNLAKLQLLESDPEPYYYLCLNIYAVTGITNGLRAEWQVFVNVPDDPADSSKPRYMAVGLTTDSYSMDPINVITFPGTLVHSVEGDIIYSFAESFGGTSFESTITLPEESKRNYVDGKQEWLEANDYIYWHNGICDKAFYSGDLLNVKILSIDPSDVVINDTTPWMDFTEPDPESVIIFMNGLEFVISPWWNI